MFSKMKKIRNILLNFENNKIDNISVINGIFDGIDNLMLLSLNFK